MDLDGIGSDMKSIPIFAESDVPKVKILPKMLDFGEIFLRYKKTKEIELINESNLSARYIIHDLSKEYSSLGIIETANNSGKILPQSSLKVNVSLITQCLKSFKMNLVVEIISDDNTQEVIVIKANSIGPIVEISHKEIDFGDVEVLKRNIRKINITNKSVIDADFYAFTKTTDSIFKPFQKHYVLKPEQR